jgi:hypothetical protein
MRVRRCIRGCLWIALTIAALIYTRMWPSHDVWRGARTTRTKE